jgi:hypothetical protein
VCWIRLEEICSRCCHDQGHGRHACAYFKLGTGAHGQKVSREWRHPAPEGRSEHRGLIFLHAMPQAPERSHHRPNKHMTLQQSSYGCTLSASSSGPETPTSHAPCLHATCFRHVHRGVGLYAQGLGSSMPCGSEQGAHGADSTSASVLATFAAGRGGGGGTSATNPPPAAHIPMAARNPRCDQSSSAAKCAVYLLPGRTMYGRTHLGPCVSWGGLHVPREGVDEKSPLLSSPPRSGEGSWAATPIWGMYGLHSG